MVQAKLAKCFLANFDLQPLISQIFLTSSIKASIEIFLPRMKLRCQSFPVCCADGVLIVKIFQNVLIMTTNCDIQIQNTLTLPAALLLQGSPSAVFTGKGLSK